MLLTFATDFIYDVFLYIAIDFFVCLTPSYLPPALSLSPSLSPPQFISLFAICLSHLLSPSLHLHLLLSPSSPYLSRSVCLLGPTSLCLSCSPPFLSPYSLRCFSRYFYPLLSASRLFVSSFFRIFYIYSHFTTFLLNLENISLHFGASNLPFLATVHVNQIHVIPIKKFT